LFYDFGTILAKTISKPQKKSRKKTHPKPFKEKKHIYPKPLKKKHK
jgi:hypothetical protein